MKRLAPVPGQGFFLSFKYVERLAQHELEAKEVLGNEPGARRASGGYQRRFPMTKVQTAPYTLSSVSDGDLFSHTQQNHQPANHHGRATRLISAAAQLLPVLCRGQALEA